MKPKYRRKNEYQVHFYMTKKEYEALKQKVEISGLTLTEYCKCVLNKSEVKAAPPADFFFLVREVKRVGTNLDQLLHKLNATGRYSDSEIRDCIDEIHDIDNLLFKTFTSGDGGS